MIISRIERVTQKKSRVVTDEELSFVLYHNELYRYHLSEGAALSDALYAEILAECLVKRAKAKAMQLLMSKDRTEGELYDRLLLGGFPQEAVQTAIEYVRGYHYIDDKRYASYYVECMKGKKSAAVMRMELKRRKVPEEYIEEALSGIDASSEYGVMWELLIKRAGEPHPLDDKEKNKLYGYLGRRGFKSSEIYRAIKAFSGSTPRD